MLAPLWTTLKEWADLVAFAHTVFALPFALSAVVLASAPQWPPLVTVLWVVLAMVGGRTYAMGLNRLLDAHYDQANPRTANRGIPAGRVSRGQAWGLTLAALALLVWATCQLPMLCVQLLPVAVVLLSVYSLMKRFSASAHLVLGLCLGSAAIAGWLAVTGVWSWWAFGLGCAVACWVAGFDLIYACQDVDFDRRMGLHSVPAQWGIPAALQISKVCHGLTLAVMALLWAVYPYTGWPMWLALGLMGAFLVWEHQLVTPQDLTRIDKAFFTLNGWISMLILASVLLTRWLYG
jgi:4-hydroxybenzoate polyprenyltransferase